MQMAKEKINTSLVQRRLMNAIDRQEWLEEGGSALQNAVGSTFEAAGGAGKSVKDFLHGVWLGHPLHPVMTDIPIGAWTAALVMDCAELLGRRRDLAPGADAAIGVGLLGATGAALSGLADYRETYGRSTKVGFLHAALNTVSTALYTTSYFLRKTKARRTAIGLSIAGYAVAGVAAFLGGELVYGEQMGVDHTAGIELPEKFTAAIKDKELKEGEMKRAEIKGENVLLVRRNGKVHAIAEKCSHLGGPLSEGKLEGDTVICPWHGSQFSVIDGHVIHGPATYAQPCFETRVRGGMIEVRRNVIGSR
jgi:nitrite reductase/ring-hydroxylating ferredoxin subunit/uncharacterized membrane protein